MMRLADCSWNFVYTKQQTKIYQITIDALPDDIDEDGDYGDANFESFDKVMGQEADCKAGARIQQSNNLHKLLKNNYIILRS